MGESKIVAEIDLMKNGVYVVKDGVLTELPKPIAGYGCQTVKLEMEVAINWQGDKPCHGKMIHDLRF